MSVNDINIALKWVQTGLTFLKWVHTTILVAWACGAVLPMFSNGILHLFPIAYEILLRDVIGDSLGFSIDQIEIRPKIRLINLIYFLLIVGIAINGTHIGFTIYDLATDEGSPIFWFLIFFTCLLGALLVLECVYFYYFIKYKAYLELRLKCKKP